MTDVLFITQDSAYPQLGALYLMDALRQKGIGSEMVASGISQRGLESVMDYLRPSVVGMSVMTAPQIGDFESHSIFLKENYPEVPIVWGGVHPTLLSDICIACNYIDYVFIGQGEEIFPELVEDIADGGKRFERVVRGFAPRRLDDFAPAWDKDSIAKYVFSERHSVRSPDSRVKNLITQSHEQLDRILGDESALEDLDPMTRLSLEQMSVWDVGLYRTDKKLFYYLLTSRGCPYKCTFCSEPLQVMHGDENDKFKWNAHSVEWVQEQIRVVRNVLRDDGVDMDGIGIWDDMFWVRHREDPRAYDILEYLKSENLRYLIEARADQLLRDEGSLMKRLADTGCLQVFIGAESASQETLNYMRKGTKAKDYFRLMKLANEYKVALRMSFIIGFPGEPDGSVNETLDFCEAVENGDFGPWVNVSGPKIFTPYPGTIEYTRSIEADFPAPSTNVEWGRINRSTEEYRYYFPWLERNLSHKTLSRIEKYFGQGYRALTAH